FVGFEAPGAFRVPWAGEAAASEWAPGDDSDALVNTEAGHLALFFAIEQVVVVLHGDEAGPVAEIGEVERLGELPCVHGGSADVAHLAGFYGVVQGFEGFLDGDFVIPAMNLIEIYVIGLETLEALI